MKLFLLVNILCVALVLGGVQAQQRNGQSSDGSTNAHNHGLFSFILDPIRSTIDHATHFLGNRIDNVADGVDKISLESFKVFMRLYNKTYSAEEIPRRMALFVNRRKEIEESVKMFREGKSTFAMRENAFVDWDAQELKKLTGTSLPDKNSLTPEELAAEEPRVGNSPWSWFGPNYDDDEDSMNLTVKAQVPATKDWRTSGCVSAPINQLKCGACYAIATMSVVESMRCLNQVSSPILSPQQIVDCSTPRAGYENYGCDGGWPTRVLKYLQDVHVATRETCYPFVRRQNACRLRQMKSTQGCTVSASPTNGRIQYKVLNNERDILYHVGTTGPVVTVMKASDKFLYYDQGIFDDPKCSRRRDDVDHAIVIVGYGRENNVDYWLIKNSWGTTTWGQRGYGKYKRGSNACSIGHWGWVVTG